MYVKDRYVYKNDERLPYLDHNSININNQILC